MNHFFQGLEPKSYFVSFFVGSELGSSKRRGQRTLKNSFRSRFGYRAEERLPGLYWTSVRFQGGNPLYLDGTCS